MPIFSKLKSILLVLFLHNKNVLLRSKTLLKGHLEPKELCTFVLLEKSIFVSFIKEMYYKKIANS